jgi:hypothetical protein
MVPINGSEEGKRGGQWMELTRADDETWAVKAETALPAAATVVAIAEEAQGRAASKRASERAKEAMMDGQGQSPREGRAGATT